MFKCRYTRARIPALINHELAVNTRRYVARHLDECPHCRAEYEAQQALRQELLRQMPLLGQPGKPALNRIWTNIQAELTSQPHPPATAGAVRPPIFMYSLGVVVLALLVVLPLMAAGVAGKAALPTHPAPVVLLNVSTPTRAAVTLPVPTLIAYVVQTAPGQTDTPEILDNTPATPEPAAGMSQS